MHVVHGWCHCLIQRVRETTNTCYEEAVEGWSLLRGSPLGGERRLPTSGGAQGSRACQETAMRQRLAPVLQKALAFLYLIQACSIPAA